MTKSRDWRFQCVECERVFDMTIETEAEEWAYGHDCEVTEPDFDPPYDDEDAENYSILEVDDGEVTE